MTETIKRRHYLVNRDLQGKYLLGNLLIAMGGALAFALITALITAGSRVFVYRDYSLHIGSPASLFFRELASAQLLYLLAGGILIIWLSILLSHRLAGPLLRMGITLDAMARGDFSERIVLRQKDQGKELATRINLVNEHVCARLAAMNDIIGRLESGLTSKQADQETCQELVQRLRAELAFFTFHRPS